MVDIPILICLVVWNIFPYVWNNNPNWLIFFQRGRSTTNQLYGKKKKQNLSLGGHRLSHNSQDLPGLHELPKMHPWPGCLVPWANPSWSRGSTAPPHRWHRWHRWRLWRPGAWWTRRISWWTRDGSGFGIQTRPNRERFGSRDVGHVWKCRFISYPNGCKYIPAEEVGLGHHLHSFTMIWSLEGLVPSEIVFCYVNPGWINLQMGPPNEPVDWIIKFVHITSDGSTPSWWINPGWWIVVVPPK